VLSNPKVTLASKEVWPAISPSQDIKNFSMKVSITEKVKTLTHLSFSNPHLVKTWRKIMQDIKMILLIMTLKMPSHLLILKVVLCRTIGKLLVSLLKIYYRVITGKEKETFNTKQPRCSTSLPPMSKT